MSVWKKYIFLVLLLIVLLCILPSAIDYLYIIGDTYPLIVTPYKQSDLLNYTSSCIGVIIAVIAIIISLSANKPNIKISRELIANLKTDTTFSHKVSIRNFSHVKVDIINCGLISSSKIKVGLGKGTKLKYTFSPICYNFPRELQAYSTTSLSFGNNELENNLNAWGSALKDRKLNLKTIYYVQLANGENIIQRYKYDDKYLKQKEKTNGQT